MSAVEIVGVITAAIPAVAGVVWLVGKIVATVGALLAARTKTKDDDEAVQSLSEALGDAPPGKRK